MSKENTYNGWTNYATWRIHLECIDGMRLEDFDLQDAETHEIAKFLDDFVRDELIIGGNELAETYANAFIDDCNFHEIAEHLKENRVTT